MSGVRIEVHISGLASLRLSEGALMGALRGAVVESGTAVQGAWIKLAQIRNVRNSGAYIAGLQSKGSVRMVQAPELRDGIITAQINVIATAPHSSIIEDGHSAYSLPDKINWNKTTGSIKRTKDGVAYLHIPFKHAAYAGAAVREAGGYTAATVKAMLPRDIHAQAKGLARTLRLVQGRQYDSSGQFTAADRYIRGTVHKGQFTPAAPGTKTRLVGMHDAGFVSSAHGISEHRRGARFVGRTGPRGRQKLENPAWQTSKFEGLFKAGAPAHSKYMTIRTITKESAGWNIPAKAGLGIARQVAMVAPTFIEPIIRAAVTGSLEGGS